jgi:hypothetical protein
MKNADSVGLTARFAQVCALHIMCNKTSRLNLTGKS